MSKKKQLTEVKNISSKGIFDDIPYFPYLATLAFLILAGIGMYHHEMWRDEHQAWLVARDAGSLADLYANMRYEGNPMLWHTFLWIFAKITWNPVVMQVFHLMIAGGFIFLLHRFSPFSRVINSLLTVNYYLVYEYAVISRGYGLGLLLAFAACVLFKKAGEKPFWLGLLLFLLANTSIFGMLMGSAIFGTLFLERYFGKNKQEGIAVRSMGIIALFWLAGAILSIWQVMPESDNSFPVAYATGGLDASRLWIGLWKVFGALFNMPDLSRPDFWNSSFFIGDDQNSFAILPLAVLAAFSLMFIRSKAVFWAFILTLGCMIGLVYYTLLTHARYLGHFWVLMILGLWLKEYVKPDNANSSLASWGDAVKKYLFPAALVICAIGGLLSIVKDVNVPFSGSAEAAKFLKEKKLTEMKIVGATDFVVSCIPSLLQNRNTYYPERGEWGTFVKWDSKREATVDFNKVLAALNEEIKKSDSVLLILTAPPTINDPKGARLLQNDIISPEVEVRILKAITETAVKDEQYYIYMAKRPGKF